MRARLLVLLLAFLSLNSCAMLRATKPTRMIAMTADQCVAIATAYCRPDIAQACQVAKDLAPLFEQLLGETHGGKQCK